MILKTISFTYKEFFKYVKKKTFFYFVHVIRVFITRIVLGAGK